MKGLYFFSFLILLSSCKDPDAALRADLDKAVFKIDMLENQLAVKKSVEAGDIVHHVYLDVKDDLAKEEFGQLISELNKLRGISVLETFSIGKFKDLEDKRSLSAYEVALSMSFKNMEDYKVYQNHPAHIKLKVELDKYLAAAPVTYDYIQQ